MSVNVNDDSEVEDADEHYRYRIHATLSVRSPVIIRWVKMVRDTCIPCVYACTNVHLHVYIYGLPCI